MPDAAYSCEAFSVETAARGSLLKIGRWKQLLIRSLDALLFPLVQGITLLHRFQPERREGEIRKILVVEYWQLGDLVILLPFLQNLRFHYPHAWISLLASPRALALLEGQDLVDELIPVRLPWAEHFARWRKYNPFSSLWIGLARTVLALRRQGFDLALSGRMDIRDNLLLWLIGARRRVGYAVGGGQRLLTEVVVPDLRRPHRSQVWLRLLEALGKPILQTQPRLFLSHGERAFAEKFLAEKGIEPSDFLVGFHAGARIPTRSWGTENFAAVEAQLASAFPVKVLWFCDPKGPAPRAPLPAEVIRVSLPIRQFLAVLARCRLLVCNDSGPMHMAAALGVPVVAVFGPQEPAWFGPLGLDHRIVIRPEFWCRPCFDYCRFDQPYCLRTISREEVGEAARSALREFFRRREPQSTRSAEATVGEQYSASLR